MTKYSEEDQIRMLDAFTKQWRRLPAAHECKPKNGLPSLHAIVNRFGSFNTFIATAGYEPRLQGWQHE